MEVYNHLDGLDRVEKEIARLDNMAVNSWHQKNKNWCQIGVKPQKTPKKGKNNKSQKRRKPSKIKALREISQRVGWMKK